MTNMNVANFKTKEQMRLDKLIFEAKRMQPYPQVVWEEARWNLEGFVKKRNHEKRSLTILFTRSQKNQTGVSEPFAQPFGDFAKLIIASRAAARGAGYTFQKAMVNALRYLYEALFQSGSADPARLLKLHFQTAAKNAEKSQSHGGAYQIGQLLQEIAGFVDENRLTSAAIHFKNIISHPPHMDGTDEKSQAKGMEKMPSQLALDALASASNAPESDNERIMLRVIDLLVAGGFRIGEALTLPLDCWVEETGRDQSSSGNTGQAVKRCGLRYIPEKGGLPVVKWLPDRTVPFAKRAVEDLTRLCAGARRAAALLEKNPDRVPLGEGLISPDEHVDRYRLSEIMGLNERTVRQIVSFELKVPLVNTGNKGHHRNLYRLGDVEKALMARRPELDVVKLPGNRMQKLSESLCVMFLNQFDSAKNAIRFLPQLIGYRQIRTALGAEEYAASVFSRRGLTNSDGTRMQIKTHAFRHWLNTLADQGGLSDIQLALWMGRRDVSQNVAYKHGTVVQRAKWAREALQSGKLSGAISEIYDEINDPVEKGTFLETFVNVAHFTDFGVCLHDYSLDPCQHHLNCVSGCGEFARTKGDQEERKKLRELRVFTARELELAKKAVQEDEFNADAWVNHNQRILDGCDAALAVDEDESGENVTGQAKDIVKIYPEEKVLGKPLVEAAF